MVLNVIFGFLLAYTPIVAVTIFSVCILILINIFYKILIKQNEAKQLKEKTKELNKQMREAQKAGNKDEANRLMSETMRENGRLMRLTMKPMIVSFIIVIVFLPWLSDAYGDRLVTLENNAGKFTLQGVDYSVVKSENSIAVNGEAACISCTKKIENIMFEITQQDGKISFAPVVAMLPVSLPFVGNTLGWLGWYIIVSIPVAILTRRLMKIYV